MQPNKKRPFSDVNDEAEEADHEAEPRSDAEMVEFAEKAIDKYIKLGKDDRWVRPMTKGTRKNPTHYQDEWARVVNPPQDVNDSSVLHIIQPYTSEELAAIRKNTLAGAAPGDPAYKGGRLHIVGPTKTVRVANYQKTFLNVKEFLDEQKFIHTIVNKGWLRFGGKKRKRKTRKRKKTRRRNKKKRKSRRKKTRR